MHSPALAQLDTDTLPDIVTNENRASAGTLTGGVLELDLEARTGVWRPEKSDGPGLVVHAFAEEGGSPRIPAPLVRVPEGTELRIRIRNRIADMPLVVHGLHTRPGEVGDTLQIPPAGEREVRFQAGAPGTYFYWATTTGAPTTVERVSDEAQLGGAFIVDPRGGSVAEDRVFVIGIWLDPDDRREEARFGDAKVRRAAVVNGLSWPHTERFRYAVRDSIRWRWINASDRPHPMHLHGSYFLVESRGDAVRDTIYQEEERRLGVTETMQAGGTFTLLWVPERPGNWLFHCHTLAHMSPEFRPGSAAPAEGRHTKNHALGGMAGLVLGVEVLPSTTAEPVVPPPVRRHVRLVAAVDPGRYGTEPGYGFLLDEGGVTPAYPGRPGPPLVLTRGEPVQITVVNRLPEPTSVHWHGIELESYFDGVADWSGMPERLAPAIAPGDSFVVQMTPPRTGTFIYHTHFDELRQLTSGMYGALIVLEPGQSFDPRTDRVLLLSNDGPAPVPNLLLNGKQAPELELEIGTTYRLRLISIAAHGARVVSLSAGDDPVSWRAIAKDGADLPPAQRLAKPARQLIGVGETYDFEYTPEAPGTLRLEVRQRGELVLAGIIKIAR
ncbi:MAG: multicopper oxidase domain-containing protein [Gemmatimonadetes bacterium]|nr:multicopper oxidase domain-containing protein [Gemmatimonadota bacterium]